MQLENNYLQIQGIVEKNTLHELIGNRNYKKQNTVWCFVDYAPATFNVHAKFDFVLEGEEIKKMLPHIYDIRLLTVLDQFGNSLASIQQGWKTVCRFEFIGKIPNGIYSLPELDTWRYNKNSLKIANHNDLFIEENTPGSRAYTEVMKDFLFYALQTNSINRKNFINDILKIYAANKEELSEKVPPGLFSDAEQQLLAIEH